jgi:hypothetical protein
VLGERSRGPCPGLVQALDWAQSFGEPDLDSAVPTGRVALLNVSQALRTWLLSCSPYGTKPRHAELYWVLRFIVLTKGLETILLYNP